MVPRLARPLGAGALSRPGWGAERIGGRATATAACRVVEASEKSKSIAGCAFLLTGRALVAPAGAGRAKSKSEGEEAKDSDGGDDVLECKAETAPPGEGPKKSSAAAEAATNGYVVLTGSGASDTRRADVVVVLVVVDTKGTLPRCAGFALCHVRRTNNVSKSPPSSWPFALILA